MWHRNLDNHSRIMPERICVCVYVPLYLIYFIWDHAVSACSMKNYKGMITVLQLLYGKWIWITPAILSARENSFEAIRLCALPVLQASLRLCNSFYGSLMCVRLCLSVFMKNGWIWEFLPVFHISLNTSRCNQLNLSPSKINGHVHIMRTMERGWQVIMMCVRNNVITEAGPLTRQIGKGVTQLITLDHLLFRITLSSICTAVQHESWPHPLKYKSCWKATPTHFLLGFFFFPPHIFTCSLHKNDHPFGSILYQLTVHYPFY